MHPSSLFTVPFASPTQIPLLDGTALEFSPQTHAPGGYAGLPLVVLAVNSSDPFTQMLVSTSAAEFFQQTPIPNVSFVFLADSQDVVPAVQVGRLQLDVAAWLDMHSSRTVCPALSTIWRRRSMRPTSVQPTAKLGAQGCTLPIRAFRS